MCSLPASKYFICAHIKQSFKKATFLGIELDYLHLVTKPVFLFVSDTHVFFLWLYTGLALQHLSSHHFVAYTLLLLAISVMLHPRLSISFLVTRLNGIFSHIFYT